MLERNRVIQVPESRSHSVYRPLAVVIAFLLVAMSAMTPILGSRSANAQTGTATASPSGATPADIVPDSTLIYLAIDLDPTSSQVIKANALLQRIGAEGSVTDLFNEASTTATGEDMTESIDMTALAGGEAALAVFDLTGDLSALSGAIDTSLGSDDPFATAEATPTAETMSSMAAIFTPSDPDAAYTSAEAQLEQDAANRGETITDQTYEGVTIRYLTGDTETDSSPTALARVSDYIVFGMAVSDVEKVIDTEAGRTPALSATDAYATVTAELQQDWLGFGLVNGEEVANLVLADPAAANVDLSTIDVDALKAHSGFVVWADDPGFRFDSIMIPTGDTAPSTATNFEATLPGKVPGDAAFFTNGTDLGKTGILDTIFLTALGSLTGSVGTEMATPDPSKTADELLQEQYAQLESVLGFNLKTDFIDQMVGEWGVAVWGINPTAIASMDTSGAKVLLVSDTQTAATVADAVSKFSLLIQAGLSGQGQVTTRVIGESQLSVLTVDPGDGSTPLEIEYGVVNGQFVISLNGAIDEYVADSGTKLADDAGYQAALALLPTEHGGETYVDLRQIVPIVEGLSAAMATDTNVEFTDASEKCAAYATQADAQAAFDADQSLNWELDQDFDGQACEDYFNPATPTVEASPVASSGQYDALTSFAAVSYEKDGMTGTSAILVIAES